MYSLSSSHRGSDDDSPSAEGIPSEPWTTALEYSTPKREWDDDRKSTRCSVCGVQFTVTIRRHHCRRCGILVCDKDGADKLALPGYHSEQRVCAACRSETLKLREFIAKHSDVMIRNTPLVRGGPTTFNIYSGGAVPYTSAVWLSNTLLLIMTNDANGKMIHYPVHGLSKITEGPKTAEFRGRMKKTVMCCISVDDDTIVGHEEEFFSLHFTDGRTLDLQCSAPIAREEWLRRFNAVLHLVPFASWHHARGNVDQRKCLNLEMDRCSGGPASARLAKRGSTPTAASSSSSSSSSSSRSSGVERKTNAEDSAEAQRIKGKYARLRD